MVFKVFLLYRFRLVFLPTHACLTSSWSNYAQSLYREIALLILKKHPEKAHWSEKGTSTLCRAAHSGKVRQGHAAKVAKCHKYMWTLCRLGCGVPFDAARPKNSIGKLSVPSKEAVRHMMSRGLKMVSASLRKKSDKFHRSRSTVFVTWRRSARNSFFMWTWSH